MGFLKATLEFIRRTLGLSHPEPVLSLGTVGAAAADSAEDDEDDEAEAGGGERDEDATRDGQLSIEEEWTELQLFIERCEAEQLDLAGLDVADPAGFWARQGRIEQANAGGMNPQHAVIAAGFRGVEHWEQVSRYFQAKWSELVRHASGEREIRPREAFTAAAAQARGSWTPQTDAGLLEPVHGVSLDQWARASAILAETPADASPAEIDAALAPVGLTRERFADADAAWQERMRRDDSRTIAARLDATRR